MVQNSKKDLIKYHPKKEGEEGFSLIELVVVVGVLAVLSAIAIPSFICFPKRARATAALAALRQIKTECALKEAEAKPEIFTSSALDGYTIQTTDSNSCAGSNGVISALPDNTNELPTFNLAAATGSLTYEFKGKTGTNFTECLGMICGDGVGVANLPPNESTLFGPDSGLSCREVKVGKTHFGYSQIFTDGYWAGSQLKFLKTTFSVGEKDFVVDGLGVQQFMVKRKGAWVISRDGIKNWVKFTADKINESEEGYSAEVDSEDPFGLKFYLPNGEEANQIEMRVEQRPKGELSTYVSPVLGDLNYDPKTMGWSNYDPSNGIFKLNPEKDTTTVCDGK